MIKLLFKSIVIGTFFSFFLLILGTLVIFGYASSHLPYQLSLSVASMPIALVEFTKDGFRFKFFLTGLLTLLTVFTLLGAVVSFLVESRLKRRTDQLSDKVVQGPPRHQTGNFPQ